MKVINWENDMLASPEKVVVDYCERHYPNLDLEMLSGLSRRDPSDIIDSIRKDCRAVVMNPHMLDKEQVLGLISMLAAGLYGYVYGEDLDEFVFITSAPKETADTIVSWCMSGGWDDNHKNPRNAMVAILGRCRCYLVGPDGDKYEITTNGWRYREFNIVFTGPE